MSRPSFYVILSKIPVQFDGGILMPHHHVDMSAHMRATRALELRVKGKQWGEIATICGYRSRSAAFDAAQRLLDQHEVTAVEEYRKIEEMRLDAMLAAIYDRATGFEVIDNKTGAGVAIEADLECQAMVLKISARRSKLLGLDTKPDLGDYLPGQVLIREIAAPLDKV